MAPQFEAAARDLRGEAILAKLDTERSPATAARFAIHSIPTLIAFTQGKEVARQSGALDQAWIVAWVRSLRAPAAR